MVDGQRDVGIQGFADRLAVVDGLGIGQQFEVGFEAVGNLQQDVGTGRCVGLAPLREGGMGGVQGQFDILGGRAGSLRVNLAIDRGDYVEVLAFDRCGPLTVDEVVVFGLVGDFCAGGAGSCVEHVVSPVFSIRVTGGKSGGRSTVFLDHLVRMSCARSCHFKWFLDFRI